MTFPSLGEYMADDLTNTTSSHIYTARQDIVAGQVLVLLHCKSHERADIAIENPFYMQIHKSA